VTGSSGHRNETSRCVEIEVLVGELSDYHLRSIESGRQRKRRMKGVSKGERERLLDGRHVWMPR
jgi:hypothetical protein